MRGFRLLLAVVALALHAGAVAAQDLRALPRNPVSPVPGGDPTGAEPRLSLLEQRAEAALQAGDLRGYRDRLGEIVVLGLTQPGIDPLRRADAQSRLANYLHDHESDFVSARMLAEGALEIYRARLGEGARRTLKQRADLIFFRLQQVEMFDVLQRAGIAPAFGTGDPVIDGRVTEADIAVFRALSRVVDREEPDEEVRTAIWANYMSMLNRAGRYEAAIAESLPRLRDLDARARRGAPISAGVRFLTLQTVVKTFVSGGRDGMALQLYTRGLHEALHYLRSAIWERGVDAVAGERVIARLFAEGFIHLAWRVGQQPQQAAPDQKTLRAHAFEAAQLAGYNPAAASVARQGFLGALGDPAIRRDLLRWSQTSPLDAAEVAEHRAAQRRIEAAHPGFIEALVPTPVPVAALQGSDGAAGLLGDDEALVLILNKLSDTDGTPGANGLVFAVTREGSAWAELPIGWGDLTFAILSLHHHLDPRGARLDALRAPQSAGSVRPGVADFDFDSAHGLYRAFFGDPAVAALIADKPVWTIVPQGEVLGLPFAALLAEDPGGGRQRGAEAMRDLRWLGQTRALNVVPSVAALQTLRARAGRAAPGETLAYLGLGDPAFQGDTGAVLRSAEEIAASGARRAEMIRALPRLPGTRREVETLAGLFGAAPDTVLLGAAASEAELRRLNDAGTLGRARIVHFATHGLLAGAFEGLGEPALALTPPEQGERPDGEDGLLTASEAARLGLAAEWVILSACDTAGEGRIDGDGLGGLVQGFFAAGAGNLLVSHWRVDDAAAERLITATLESHLKGVGKAEALRRAMVALAGDRSRDGGTLPNSHPSVWAPFVLVGGG